MIARRSLVKVSEFIGLVAASAVLGYGLNHLPPAREVGTFWWGNSAWPYIALPLVCGARFARRPIVGSLVGAASATAMIVGFYAQQLINERAVDRRLGAPLHGPSWYLHVPWIYYGLVIGAACGLLGANLRWRSVLRVLGMVAVAEAVGLALKVEGHISYLPMLWHSPPTPFGWTAQNLAGWCLEFAVGVCLIWFGSRTTRAARESRPPAEAM